MFGTLETKDLAQVAVSIAGAAILFIYFNRRANSLNSRINDLAASVEQRDTALEEIGTFIQSMNERLSTLERQNSMLRQQLASLQKQAPPPQERRVVKDSRVLEEKPDARREIRRRPTSHTPLPQPSSPAKSLLSTIPEVKSPVSTNSDLSEKAHIEDIEPLSGATMDLMLKEELKDLTEDEDDAEEVDVSMTDLKKTL